VAENLVVCFIVMQPRTGLELKRPMDWLLYPFPNNHGGNLNLVGWCGWSGKLRGSELAGSTSVDFVTVVVLEVKKRYISFSRFAQQFFPFR